MTPNTEQGVTAEDREAAADLLDEISSLLDHVGIGQVADLIRDGEYDEHEAADAFRRHRLSSTAALEAEVERLRKTGLALLEAAERHIFGDECKAERDAFRAALQEKQG